ncbi:hypothetical protein IKP85_00080 [bacterium]|nr:hypothetical protein [bacterium]
MGEYSYFDNNKRVDSTSLNNNTDFSGQPGETEYLNTVFSNPGAIKPSNIVKNLTFAMSATLAAETKENFINSYLNFITFDNVKEVLKGFKETYGNRSFLSVIMKSRDLDIDVRIRLAKRIFEVYYNRLRELGINPADFENKINKEFNAQKSSWLPANADDLDVYLEKITKKCETLEKFDENAPNGKIDQNFGQGAAGDCWLIAAIKGIAKTPKGKELLNNSIKANPDGSITVTLKGVNKTYRISKQELEKGKSKYSYGDPDVRAIEIAIEKYIKDSNILGIGNPSNNFKSDTEGNTSSLAFYLLTGKGDMSIPERMVRLPIDCWFSDEQIDNFNKPNHVAIVAAAFKDPVEVPGGILLSHHAYTVARSDANNVYLINPWDTSKEFAVSRRLFKEFFNQIDEFDL